MDLLHIKRNAFLSLYQEFELSWNDLNIVFLITSFNRYFTCLPFNFSVPIESFISEDLERLIFILFVFLIDLDFSYNYNYYVFSTYWDASSS